MKSALLPESGGPLRRRLHTITFALFVAYCAAIIVPWVTGAVAPFELFLTPFKLCLRLPLAAAILFAAASNGVTAVVIAEVLRGVIPSGSSWSDRAYFRIVMLLWAVFVAISLTFLIVWRGRLSIR